MFIEVALAIGAFEASIVYRHARRLIRTDTHGDTHDACTTRKGYISLRHIRPLGEEVDWRTGLIFDTLRPELAEPCENSFDTLCGHALKHSL